MPHWPVSLTQKPAIALMAIGIHGPRSTERFGSGPYWWLHLYRYTATMRVSGSELPLRPGCASIIPPGAELEYDFQERSVHLCAHFTLTEEAACSNLIPAVQDLGDDFARIYAGLEDAAAWFASNPQRAEVRLWDLLWQLADRGNPRGAPPVHAHPAPVERTQHLIELRLGEPLSVKELAEEVGVSHNQLTRLFHVAVGDTVIGYIRRRRVQRAHHLLLHTTLPVKTIAAQVGVEDPSLFYKLIREHLGKSPLQVRQDGE